MEEKIFRWKTNKQVDQKQGKIFNKAIYKQRASLPVILSEEQSKTAKIHLLNKSINLFKQNGALPYEEISSFQKLTEDNIYSKVHDFIKQIMHNHGLHFEILKQFQSIDLQMKHSLKKSIKILPTKKKLFISKKNSLNQLILSNKLEQPTIKQVKVCLKENNQQNISIKLINSHQNNLSRKAMKQIKQNDNISLKKIATFKDKFILQSIQSSQNLDQIHSQSDDKISNDKQNSLSNEDSANIIQQISIVMFDQGQDIDSQLFSQKQHLTLKDLDLPKLKLSDKLIEEIFDSPSPFLINLSLCLLFKFFLKSKFQPEVSQIGWLLGISTLVAYKIFIDETIEGLVQYYSEVLKMKAEKIRYLERWFLEGLNYEVYVSNKHYVEMLIRLVRKK